MKNICIDGPVFLTMLALKKSMACMIDVYCYGNYIGMIETNKYRLRYKFNTQDTKYYTIEKRA